MPKNRSADFPQLDSRVDSQAASEADSPSASNSEDETRTAVRHTAVRLLARREHGRAELRDKLRSRGHAAPCIEFVLDDLAERGLQCDQRFAESYARMRMQRGYGGLKIRAELQSRDVDSDIIAQALYPYRSDWAENAEAALRKKYDENDFIHFNVQELAKAKRFLWSRGYNSADITIAVKRIKQPVN